MKLEGMYMLVVDGHESEINLAFGEAMSRLVAAFEDGSGVATIVRQA
jgi:hypothetical protein